MEENYHPLSLRIYWIYWVYGLILFIPAVIFLIISNIGNKIDDAVELIWIIALAVIPFFIGMIYLILAFKKVANPLTDLSIKLGIIPLLILLFFTVPVGLYADKLSLFPENYFVHYIIPIVEVILLIISFFMLLVGLFQTKVSNE